jgi:multidrug resistance efflux pump
MEQARDQENREQEPMPDDKQVVVRPAAKVYEAYSREIVRRTRDFSGAARKALGPEKRSQQKKFVIAAAILAAILFPVVTWMNYQSANIISTNAIVRSHVTDIGTRLKGIVTDVRYEAGDYVSEGMVLATLEDSHIEAEVMEAGAVLEGLRQQYQVELLEIDFAKKRVDQDLMSAAAKLSAANAETVAARIKAEEAARAAAVRRDLFTASGAISGEIVADAESEQRQAAAMLDASRADLNAGPSERNRAQLEAEAIAIRERRIGILEADIRRAEARLAKAEADLAGATIRAPADGAIIRRIIEPGGSVDAGQSIISMRIGSDIWVEAWIDEKDLADIAAGNSAVVMLQPYPDQEFIGNVTKVGLSTDFEMPDADIPQPRFARMRGTPVVGVRIQLDDPPAELVPGLSATVAIQRAGR